MSSTPSIFSQNPLAHDPLLADQGRDIVASMQKEDWQEALNKIQYITPFVTQSATQTALASLEQRILQEIAPAPLQAPSVRPITNLGAQCWASAGFQFALNAPSLAEEIPQATRAAYARGGLQSDQVISYFTSSDTGLRGRDGTRFQNDSSTALRAKIEARQMAVIDVLDSTETFQQAARRGPDFSDDLFIEVHVPIRGAPETVTQGTDRFALKNCLFRRGTDGVDNFGHYLALLHKPDGWYFADDARVYQWVEGQGWTDPQTDRAISYDAAYGAMLLKTPRALIPRGQEERPAPVDAFLSPSELLKNGHLFHYEKIGAARTERKERKQAAATVATASATPSSRAFQCLSACLSTGYRALRFVATQCCGKRPAQKGS